MKGRTLTDAEANSLAVYMSENPLILNELVEKAGKKTVNKISVGQNILSCLEYKGFLVALDDETSRYFVLENEKLKEVKKCLMM